MIQANNSKKNFKMLDGFKDTSVYQLLNAYEGKELKLIVSKLSSFFFFSLNLTKPLLIFIFYRKEDLSESRAYKYVGLSNPNWVAWPKPPLALLVTSKFLIFNLKNNNFLIIFFLN
jgi:hypothetical protein